MDAVDVVFLGAGFAHAATEGAAPLMRNFFDRLDERKYWSLWHFLNQCYDDPHSADIEDALLRVDQLAMAPLDGVDRFFDECRRRCSEIHHELDAYVVERLAHLEIKPNYASNLLFQAGKHTTVITTNYDNVAERILSGRPGLVHRVPQTNCHHCKMCRILRRDCECGPTSAIEEPSWQGSLLKLHGSVAWRMCRNSQCDQASCLVPDAHCRPFEEETCACCGEPSSPVLIPPSMVKSFGDFAEIRRMWNAAYEALTQATNVLFFGFSFAQSDALICEMMRSTLGRSKNLKQVGIVDIAADHVAEQIRSVLSDRSDVTVTTFFATGDYSRPDWFVKRSDVEANAVQAEKRAAGG
jgi:NAD-dependent SIR2 family protein deacetylase